MFGKNFNALRINYIQEKLSTMVHGYFGAKDGFQVVYVTHDPIDKSITKNKYKVFRVTSKQGRFYAPLVKDYLELKREYEQLLGDWDRQYKEPYVLSQKNWHDDPGKHNLNYQHFVDAHEYQNTYPFKNQVTYDGKIYRSKNEAHIAKILKIKKIEFKVEPEVPVGLEYIITSNCRYADMLCGVRESDRSFYLEVVGGKGLPRYKENNVTKLMDYYDAGYRDMRDVVMLYVDKIFDDEYFEAKINEVLELMSPRV